MDRNGGGKESLYKSTDAGLSWVNIPLDSIKFLNANLSGISFPTEEVGYVIIDQNSPRRLTLFRSHDGGMSWDSISPAGLRKGIDVPKIDFPSEKVGFVATNNIIYSSKDAGQTWNSKTLAGLRFGSVKDLDFFDDDHGIIGAWDGTFAYKGAIYTTVNGGATWDSLIFDSNYTVISSVQQVSKTLAIALGENSWPRGQMLYKTFNNGTSWDTLSIAFLKDSSDKAIDFHFNDGKIGYLVTQKGYIYQTVDGGKSWSIVHKEKYGLTFIESSGASVYTAGTVGIFLVEDLNLSVEVDFEDSTFRVFPNPISVGGEINFSEPINGPISIYESTGKLVYSDVAENWSFIGQENLNLKIGLHILITGNEIGSSIKLIVK